MAVLKIIRFEERSMFERWKKVGIYNYGSLLCIIRKET